MYSDKNLMDSVILNKNATADLINSECENIQKLINNYSLSADKIIDFEYDIYSIFKDLARTQLIFKLKLEDIIDMKEYLSGEDYSQTKKCWGFQKII